MASKNIVKKKPFKTKERFFNKSDFTKISSNVTKGFKSKRKNKPSNQVFGFGKIVNI